MIDRATLGHLDQVALAARREAIDVRVRGGIDVRLYERTTRLETRASLSSA